MGLETAFVRVFQPTLHQSYTWILESSNERTNGTPSCLLSWLGSAQSPSPNKVGIRIDRQCCLQSNLSSPFFLFFVLSLRIDLRLLPLFRFFSYYCPPSVCRSSGCAHSGQEPPQQSVTGRKTGSNTNNTDDTQHIFHIYLFSSTISPYIIASCAQTPERIYTFLYYDLYTRHILATPFLYLLIGRSK